MAIEQANLGLATTRELLKELEARFKVSGYLNSLYEIEEVRLHLNDNQLDYRTVDS